MPAIECFLHENSTPPYSTRDFEIVRGDDAQLAITFKDSSTYEPINWTGWTFAAKVKAAVDGAVWATATVTHGGTNGRVLITFPSAQTALLTPGAIGVWDLQGTSPTALIRTFVRGDAPITGDVTP